MTNLSIIIVNYRVKKEILRCIDSIYKSKPGVAFEIIVIDNDEKNTIEHDLKKQFPRVKYVKSLKNIGFGAGCNLGAKHAKGEYLFFLNPDTELLSDALNELYKFIVNKKNAGAVSPLLIDKNKKVHKVIGSQFPTPSRVIFSLSSIHKLFPNNFIARKFFLKYWGTESARQVDVFPGTAFLIKKDIFEKAGKFDENYFLFYEEADFSRKIFDLGYKNYIVPSAKLIHLGGKSTKTRKDMRQILQKSQFYYFKKWHGLLGAIIVQVFTSISKVHLLLTAILLVGFFLRVFKLNELMVFIGDQGWFYISARDMVLTGKIPLVGITSSHTWLHQGPYWTYILAVIFKLFNFNPLAPAYFTALLGTAGIFLIYKLTKKIISQRAAIFASALYASSPLIVANERMPYHTAPISFLTILLTYSLYKWTKGNEFFFPISIFILGVLYNFELATVSLWGVLFILLIYGLFCKKDWVEKIFKKRILLFSAGAFISSMLPILIYDFSHGFLQTVVFFSWIIYQGIKFFPTIITSGVTNNFNTIYFLAKNYSNLIFPYSLNISLLIFILSFSYFFYALFKENKGDKKITYRILLIMFLVSFLGFLVNRTSSDAYLPIFFPILIIITSVIAEVRKRFLSALSILFLFIIVILNFFYLISNNFSTNAQGLTFKDRIKATGKIIKISSSQKYNLLGEGEGSRFESFTMNYEYLLWWKGHPPSRSNEKFKIYISETPKGITIRR